MAPRVYLAPCLVQYRAEVNAMWPGRDKASDGWIGDAAHATRISDHNPDPLTGVVRAYDTDKDGVDVDAIIERARRHPSVNYIIWQRRLAPRSNGFRWIPYTGTNPHDKHVHISLRWGAGWENDQRTWFTTTLASDPTSTAPTLNVNPSGGTLPPGLNPEDDMTPDQAHTLDQVRDLLAQVAAGVTYVQDQVDVDGELRGALYRTEVGINALIGRAANDMDVDTLAQALAPRLAAILPLIVQQVPDDDLAVLARVIGDAAQARTAPSAT